MVAEGRFGGAHSSDFSESSRGAEIPSNVCNTSWLLDGELVEWTVSLCDKKESDIFEKSNYVNKKRLSQWGSECGGSSLC